MVKYSSALIVSLLGSSLQGSNADGLRNMMGQGNNVVTVTGKITVTNLAPEDGTRLTPVWVGLHDGGFDLYDRGAPVSPELERLAEDGNTQPLSTLFNMDSGAAWDGVAGGAPIQPDTSVEVEFSVTMPRGSPLYLSYATMVLPSNDAFLANGDPRAHRITLPSGRPVRCMRPVVDSGRDVLDAGSEVNDESRETTAFFGQSVPDTGVVENGVVDLHPGFLPVGSGGILDDPMFANADFTQDPYPMLKIEVEIY